MPNEINSDTFLNHFKVVVRAGDTLIVKSNLQNTLTDQWFSRCAGNSTAYYTGILVQGASQSCSLNLKHTFTAAGEYLVSVGYPDGNSGYFEAALIAAGQNPPPTVGGSGTPDQPRVFDLSGNNSVASDDFYNYYAVDAKAGETIFIQTYLDRQPSGTDAARCVGGASYASYYSYGVLMNDEPTFVCGSYFERRFLTDGRYRFNFRTKHGASGFFRVVISGRF
jgi:hypothetical protein